MTNAAASSVDLQVNQAKLATYAAFFASGFAFASWASRIPQVRDALQLSPSELGLVLLAIAAGSLIALPLSGPIVTRYGSQRTITVMAILLGISMLTIGLGYLFGVVPLVIGLFLFGFAQGAWDVAMNVQGAIVERGLGRAIMPRFHAGWSVGTVAGALIGAGMVALSVPVTGHLVAVAVICGVSVPFAVKRFIPDHGGDSSSESEDSSSRSSLAAWREPRTLLVGLFVFAFAFAEGTGNDWTSIALIDSYGTDPAVGALGFALFLAAMTLGRWFGPGALDRHGRVKVLRVMAAVSITGLLLFVFGQATPVAFVGAVLWGVGLALGFPVGMSAGADDPTMAAARVSVVASIGYCAFLSGPPLIGLLGEHITVLRALTVVVVLLAMAMAISGAVRPLPVAEAVREHERTPVERVED